MKKEKEIVEILPADLDENEIVDDSSDKGEGESSEPEVRDVDLSTLRIVSVDAIVPLDPCIVTAEAYDPKSDDYIKIGIPGFFVPTQRNFIQLDGKPLGNDFNERFMQFLKKKGKEISDVRK